MSGLVPTLVVLGGLGLFFGLLLSLAGMKFRTKTDPKLESLKDILPGVNCGGCGLSGCNAFAEEVFLGNAETDGCPVGGSELNFKIADILGINASVSTRCTAFVRCIGGEKESLFLFKYHGVADCRAAVRLVAGGSKGCGDGCLGGGSCVTACLFDAIQIVNGIARVDDTKCTACTVCVKACPKGLIEMLPISKQYRVGCNTHDTAKRIRANCTVGCIGCQICVKNCEAEAIYMDNRLARITYEKCNNCGVCATKCPRKCFGKKEKNDEN